MKNKIIGCLVLILLVITSGCSIDKYLKTDEKTEPIVRSVPLMEYDKYSDIDINNVESILFIRLTEAGRQDERITDKVEINNIYDKLSKLEVGQEVLSSCEDNTKIYVFNMKNGSSVGVEIECEWLVVGNKRYELK